MLIDIVHAQEINLAVQFRPRAEFRNGYSLPIAENQKPAFFVQHRGRVTMDYKSELIDFKIAAQDVRVWGNTALLSTVDNNFGIHELYTQINLKKNFAIKLGRQEIKYDNERFFGAVDWSQAALSHDALLVKYTTNKVDAQLGVAYNQSGIRTNGTYYNVGKNYKTLQYLWARYSPNDVFKISGLFLNNGMQASKNNSTDTTKTNFSQTFGTYMLLTKGKIKADLSAYYQFGKTQSWDNNKLSAFEVSASINYQPIKLLNIGIGYEYLSGNKSNSTKTNAFTPFYGTNHKFNGWMDYYFVGNHTNSVGLQDINAQINIKHDKFSTSLIYHHFNTADGSNYKLGNLGDELDFQLQVPIYKFIKCTVGYSHYFTTDELNALKGITTPKKSQDWLWFALDINTTIFNWKKKDDTNETK